MYELLTLSLLRCAIPSAEAGPIEAWSYSSFVGGASVSGIDGWESGYALDPWRGYSDGATRWAYPLTDDYGGEWGSGDSLDNWLVNAAVPVGDGLFSAAFFNHDDDAIGLVIGHAGAGDFYLFTLCGAPGGDGPDCPLPLRSGIGAAIAVIHNGQATILAESEVTMSTDEEGTLTFGLNDGQLTATWPEGGLELSAADSTFDAVDAVGFWAYDAGMGSGNGATYVAFANPVLQAWDDDDDGVADDADNCEFDENSGQGDDDGDGVGDACDVEGDTDTDTDSDTDGDTDTDTDTDTPRDRAYEDGALSVDGDCGCDGGATGIAGLLPLLIAGVAARRRAGRG